MLFKGCYKFHCSVCSEKNDLSNNFEIDYFKKPTQFRFINLEPRMNLIFEPKIINSHLQKVCETHNKVERSMISHEYANSFIRTYILN